MKITKQWLEEKSACKEGVVWFEKCGEDDSTKVLKKLIKEKKHSWANWLIVRVMTYKQYVSYAVFAAEQVIEIFENKYPNDKRPREAIETAKKCVKNPGEKDRTADAAYAAAAAVAAYAAAADDAAADAAYAAAAAVAAYAAADAAYAAAADAAYAAAAAVAAYAAAAYAAAYAAVAAAAAAMRLKILKYGMELLGEKNDLS